MKELRKSVRKGEVKSGRKSGMKELRNETTI
jgi:hypothetical protein